MSLQLLTSMVVSSGPADEAGSSNHDPDEITVSRPERV